MDFAGHVEGTKKPAGLSGLHQSTLVIADGEFWCWRELNPRLIVYKLLFLLK